MILLNSKKERIKIEEHPFAKGGEGAIYRILQSPYKDCCVKYFHPGKLDSRIDKLDYMVKHQLVAPTNSQYRICWPLDFVYNNGACVGFVMPFSFVGSHSLYDIYLKDDNPIFDRRKKEGVENRLKLLFNIATAIDILHKEGYALIDFKPQNILFTDSGQISMIDLDSIQISHNNKLLFPATAFTIEYAFPHELNLIGKNKIISTRWDCYSFSVVAYQILLGIHPFTASTDKKDKSGSEISGLADLMFNNMFPFGPRMNDIKVAPNIQYYFYCLPSKLQEIFIHSFNLNATTPNMSSWLTVLIEVIQSKNVEENFFRITPKPPIFIVTEKNVIKEKSSDILDIKWKSFYCENIKINNTDVSTLNSAKVNIPRNREIVISLYNRNIGYRTQILRFRHESVFCIKCGSKFIDESDAFCTNCGTKRI